MKECTASELPTPLAFLLSQINIPFHSPKCLEAFSGQGSVKNKGSKRIDSQLVSCLEQCFMTLKLMQFLYSIQLCPWWTHTERYKSSCSPQPGVDIGNKAEEISEMCPGVQMVWGGPQSGELKKQSVHLWFSHLAGLLASRLFSIPEASACIVPEPQHLLICQPWQWKPRHGPLGLPPFLHQ